jgi:hypothetical protein
LLTAGKGLAVLYIDPCRGLFCAASCSRRSAVPWRRACHSPYLANSPLTTSSGFLLGGATKPLEVCGA